MDERISLNGGDWRRRGAYTRQFAVPAHWINRRIFLQWSGMDGGGYEISGQVEPGQVCRLTVCTGPVSSGTWRKIDLVGTGQAAITQFQVGVALAEDLRSAAVSVTTRVDNAAQVEIALADPSGQVIGRVEKGGCTALSHTFTLTDPELWWPDGLGDQPQYGCQLLVRDGTRTVSDSRLAMFGVRRFR